MIPHGPMKGEITWDIAIVFSNHLPIMKWDFTLQMPFNKKSLKNAAEFLP